MVNTMSMEQTSTQAAEVSGDGELTDAVVESLARALELHNCFRGSFGETTGHTLAMVELTVELAERAAPRLAADPQLRHGARLHDIGMIGVSPAVLLKQGALTTQEHEEIREHTWLGERIVAPVPTLNGVARQIIGCHHERWDGSGYPRGLRGEEIPLAARVLALVDAFDAITNGQPYRDPLPVGVAVASMEADLGSHFDPELGATFLELIRAGSPAVQRRCGGDR